MYPSKPDNSIQKKIAAFTIIVIAGIIIAAATIFGNSQKAPESASTAEESSQAETSPTPNSSEPTDSTSSAAYRDGTYTASSDYSVPRSFENIKVTLTVSNNVVTDSQIVNSEGDHESAEWQDRFAAAYKSQVVGKKLSEVQLSHVAGASDTAEGFNEALDKIKTQAQV